MLYSLAPIARRKIAVFMADKVTALLEINSRVYRGELRFHPAAARARAHTEEQIFLFISRERERERLGERSGISRCNMKIQR